MGKESFLVFHESEGLGEGGQRHLKKAERVFEHNVDLFWDDILSIEFVQDQVRVKPLGIVS